LANKALLAALGVGLQGAGAGILGRADQLRSQRAADAANRKLLLEDLMDRRRIAIDSGKLDLAKSRLRWEQEAHRQTMEGEAADRDLKASEGAADRASRERQTEMEVAGRETVAGMKRRTDLETAHIGATARVKAANIAKEGTVTAANVRAQASRDVANTQASSAREVANINQKGQTERANITDARERSATAIADANADADRLLEELKLVQKDTIETREEDRLLDEQKFDQNMQLATGDDEVINPDVLIVLNSQEKLGNPMNGNDAWYVVENATSSDPDDPTLDSIDRRKLASMLRFFNDQGKVPSQKQLAVYDGSGMWPHEMPPVRWEEIADELAAQGVKPTTRQDLMSAMTQAERAVTSIGTRAPVQKLQDWISNNGSLLAEKFPDMITGEPSVGKRKTSMKMKRDPGRRHAPTRVDGLFGEGGGA